MAVLTRALEDGTTVWLDPMRDVKSVALSVTFASGSADETPELAGATHFLEHLLFKRARRRSGAAIARMTDRLGGDCDAFTTKESVTFHVRTTAERVGAALDLLLDLTEAPAFTADDVEREREVILEEMAEARDVPEDHLYDSLVGRLWGAHPLGAPILGTESSVNALSRSRLAARFRAIARPEKTLVTAVGALEPERFLTRLARESAARRRRRVVTPLAPAAARPAPRAVRCAFHVPRPDLTQTHLTVAAQTIPWGHPLVPAAHLASIVLGGGVSSRLWRDVRERKGLAYHVGCGLTLHREAGLSVIEAATAPKNVAKLARTAGRVLSRIRRDGISAAELARARNQVRAEIALSLESTAARREAAARAWLTRGRPHEADEALAEFEAVRRDDVDEAMALLLGPPFAVGTSGPPMEGVTSDDLAGELAA